MKKVISKSARIIIFITIIFAIFIITIVISYVNSKPIINNINNISKITIYVTPWGKAKMTEDKNDIIEIVRYINTLDLKKTLENGGETFGAYYFITVYYKHKILGFNFTTSKKFMHVGNVYFKENGKLSWYTMSFEQADEIANIFDKYLHYEVISD